MKKPRPVQVEWLDAKASPGWQQVSEHADEEPAHITSVGYLVHRDKHKVVLALSVDFSQELRVPQAADSVAIPASCVKKVRYLRA